MTHEFDAPQSGELTPSSAYFRAIFDMAAVGLLLVDAQGHIVLANDAQVQLWGYAREELLGETLQRFILLDDQFVDSDLLQALLTSQRPSYTIDKRCVRKDGAVMWGRFTVSLVRDLDRQPFHTLLVCEDVTERKRREYIDQQEHVLAEALRDTAAFLSQTLRLEEILDSVLQMISHLIPFDAAHLMLLDESAQTMRVARARGYPQLDVTLKLQIPVARLPHAPQLLTMRQPVVIADTEADPGWHKVPAWEWIRSYLAVPIAVQDDVIGLIGATSATPDFYTAAHARRLQALADQAGLAIENARLHMRLEHYSEDLELRVAERTRELSEAYEQLRRLNQMKDQFVSQLNHDLSAPMANIKWYVRLLKDGKPEKREAYLQTLGQQVARLEKMLTDLTEMSYLDRGKTEFHFAKSDLNEVVTGLQGDWIAEAQNRHFALSFDLTPDLPPVMADPVLLDRAVAHLLKNALDYSVPETHITCRTGALQQGDQRWVTLSIINRGLGLTGEELEHVGERFYRGRAARHYCVDGTGLGLAICQEIVTRHGGQLVASSEPDAETTFSIWLKPATQ